jgi:hypothetical protein
MIAAPHRPALRIFVDFMTAFDKMWYPALISNVFELDMPLNLLRFIYEWLKGRSMKIQCGEAPSRKINIHIGASQGLVLGAILFRLHLHFLPKLFLRFNTHLFADDLAILIKSSMQKETIRKYSTIRRTDQNRCQNFRKTFKRSIITSECEQNENDSIS